MRLTSWLCSCLLLAACDAAPTLEEAEEEAGPLAVEVEYLSPVDPVRDSLVVRLKGIGSTSRLYVTEATLNGEPFTLRVDSVAPGVTEIAAYVSDLDGAQTLSVRVGDVAASVVGRDTFSVARWTQKTISVRVEQTYWSRIVAGESIYASNIETVFTDTFGNVWAMDSEPFRNELWWSGDGERFVRRSSAHQRVVGVEGDRAWLHKRTIVSGGVATLAEMSLTTGETISETRVIYDEMVLEGASYKGEFIGIHGSRSYLVHIADDRVTFIESGPYRFGDSQESFSDVAIDPQGVRWLASARSGVYRNAGAGWTATPGLASPEAIALDLGHDGAPWVLTADGDSCAASRWDGGLWRQRATFPRDGNQSCGTFEIGFSDGVWRGRTDGFLERYQGGMLDRRYDLRAGAQSLWSYGQTLWVGTGDALREILDYEGAPALAPR